MANLLRMKLRQTKLAAIAMSLLLAMAAAVEGADWLDDFSDGVLDEANYLIHENPNGGVITVTEAGGDPNAPTPLGYAEVFTNNPGGSYALTGVSVDLGDTVRTQFMMASAWHNYSTTSIGLTYDLSADRYLDASAGAYFIQQWRNNVMAYRHVGTAEESAVLTGVGDPESQRWTYEIVVGEDNGDGTFDVTFRVYDHNGAPMGGSVTFTTSTPTGNLYWYAADNRTVSRVYRVEIGADLGPIGPATCVQAIESGFRVTGDFSLDCYVNEVDLAMLANAWITCNDPDDPDCDRPWEP